MILFLKKYFKNFGLALTLVIISVQFGYGQILEKSVIGSSGTTFSDTSIVLDFTLGETIISSETDGVIHLRQGFHQGVAPDTTPPVANCVADFILELDENGEATITANDIDDGSTDESGIGSLSIDKSNFSCADIGPNVITLTVTDNNGNIATCNTTVTIVDNEPPVITCAPNILRNTNVGNCTYIVQGTEFDATFTDNCDNGTITNDLNGNNSVAGEELLLGNTIITWTVNDGNGQTATCTTTITVEDNQSPTAVCQDITVLLDDTGNASITPNDIDGGSTDNCGIASLTASQTDFTCVDVGSSSVTLTVTDVNGNSSTCTATITVEDNMNPIAVCQNITVQLDANGNASITPADLDGGSTDNCGIDTLSVDADTFDCSAVGPNNVILTVTDVNGNSSSCVAVVTVEDTLTPIVNCPADFTIGTDPGICGALANFAAPAPLDNCGIASTIQTQGLPSGSIFPVGNNFIEYTVTDVNGNTATCSFTITVEDDEAPMAVCQDITIQLDATGNATITANDLNGGSTDNCGVDTLSININTFDCSNVGANTVILTVTDINGLSSTCTTIVTVEDVTPPVVVCQDITVQLDATGMVTIDPALLDGGSIDGCGGALTISADIKNFDCSNVGENTVIVTATDPSGNSKTCTAIVTVEDNIGPTLVCPVDQSVTVDNGTQYELPDYFVGGLATAVDNCTDPVTINTQTPAPGTLLDPGIYSISFTAEDDFGNESTCVFILTVDETLGTGEDEQLLSNLRLYPNPTTGSIILKKPNSLVLMVLDIYDITGRLVKSVDLNQMGAEKMIQIDDFASATYLFVIKGERGQIMKHIIKE